MKNNIFNLEKKTMLKDWCDYCEGRKDFDTSDFYSLFLEIDDEAYYKEIFQYFPNSDELLERLKIVKNMPPHNALLKNDNNFLIDMSIADLKEKRKAFVELDRMDIVKIIDNVKPTFNSNAEFVYDKRVSNIWNGDFISEIDYYLCDSWLSQDREYYALFEAFYNIANDYAIQWYLGAPLTEKKLVVDNYIKLWGAGGFYILTNENLLVSRWKA